MPHDLPKTYDPAAIEARWAAYWVAERLFDQPGSADPAQHPFTVLLPPPNVTGRLHMGHMFEQAETDILVRWRRMQGDATLWIPGTDHAGIATQMMVERQLIAENTTRQQMGREGFTERVWQWRELYGNAILEQMKRLGVSVDWSREYFTMDETLSVAVREAFVRLWEQGLIYRGNYIVNWDPVQQTAVSDLEVVHEERMGKLYHIRYDLADGSGSIVIATTRPETMLGDAAIAVNPDDPRYCALHGKLLRLPLSAVNGGRDREIRIIADSWANPEFGTGAVKVTPAHDPNDYAIGERHALPKLNIMDAKARIDLPGSPYHGLDRFAARERIVEDLRSLGALVEIKDHPMSIGLSERTKAVIEPRLSTQWFLKIQPLADKAIAAVEQGHIRFTPDQYRKVYLEWMGNIHDWCLSRQLWWGHRIPAWHCAACRQITVSRQAPTACEHCRSELLTQETDVLDTWFSSGLLPFTVFGWPAATPDLATLYPTQLLITGFDILFFWVARMIMLGTHFMLDQPLPDGSARTLAQAVPFREVYIHALIRDADRQKMSKTKGNVIDPIAIVGKYGTDAVRFTLAAMASPGTDIAFSEARTEGYRAFANKIWNAARFIFMNVDRAAEAGIVIDPHTLPTASGSTELEARWITSRLNATVAEVNAALESYRFDEAASLVYQFFWGDFCDWYLEIVKLRLDFTSTVTHAAGLTLPLATAPANGHPERSEGPAFAPDSPATALTTLLATFESALRLLSPFMPFLTEELWQAIYDGAPPARSIALSRFPDAGRIDQAAEIDMTTLQKLIAAIRVSRKDLGVEEKERVPVKLRAHNLDEKVERFFFSQWPIVQRLARVTTGDFSTSLNLNLGANVQGASWRNAGLVDVVVEYNKPIDVAAECERLIKDLGRFEKERSNAERQLGNESFLAKAPPSLVEGIRRRASELAELLSRTRAALDELGCTLKI